MKSGAAEMWRRIASAILLAGFAAMLAFNAPGQMTYDSVMQLADGRRGFYDSWHPPVMAWLLGLFDAAVPGTLLFLIFQSALLLLALLAFLWVRPRAGWASAVIALLIVLTPQWLLYQGEIWKDILFADSAIAGFAALALATRNRRWLVAAVLALTLAAMTRQNGVVVLPVAACVVGMLSARRHGARKGWAHGALFLVATVGLAAGGTIALAARGDGGDGASSEIRVAQTYDLAGALMREPSLTLPELTASDGKLEKLLRSRGPALYSPLHNDPLSGDPAIGQAISDAPNGAIARAWKGLVLHHPLLYLRERLTVFRQVLLTPDVFNCHFSPVGIDGPPEVLKSLGLTARVRPRDQALANYARLYFATPVFSHLAWGALALILMIVLLRRGGDADLAVAGLLTAALLFTMTFVIISIACDYRYLVFLDYSAMAGALYVSAQRK
jgi:hypothetical protein